VPLERGKYQVFELLTDAAGSQVHALRLARVETGLAPKRDRSQRSSKG
jgi:hypothetical protein